MRFISKLTMAVAAIFFALSVSAHAGGHDTTSNSLGSKIYQVCKKWRVDQGGANAYRSNAALSYCFILHYNQILL